MRSSLLKILVVPLCSCLIFTHCGSDNTETSESNEEETASSEEVEEEIIADSSSITCPICGYSTVEALPTDYCLISYDCDSCGETLHPAVGDCCVFCTYGDEKCPSIQEEEL